MPAGESTSRLILRAVLIVVAVVLVLYVIYLLRRPLSWFVIAAFIAIAVSGPVNVLSQHMRRGLAIAVVYIALHADPGRVGALIIPSLVTQGEDLGRQRAGVRPGRHGLRQRERDAPQPERRLRHHRQARRTRPRSCRPRSATPPAPFATSGSGS